MPFTRRVTKEQVAEARKDANPEDVAAFHMHGFEMALEDALKAMRQSGDTMPRDAHVEFRVRVNPGDIQHYEATIG